MTDSLLDKMKIDCETVSDVICDFVRDRVDSGGFDGALIGVSGGVDSAVGVSLLVRALGADRVHGLHIYDRDSESKFTGLAERLADGLGLELQLLDMEEQIRETGTYDPFIMKVVPYSKLLNKLILWSNRVGSRLFYGETPFKVTLKRIDPDRVNFGFVARIAKHIEHGFNERHMTRRKILEDYAEEHNLQLFGAANRSESFVGWFVKDGVDDLPIELLLDLYKTQVRQLGEYLEVPSEILGEAPSPDMFKGIGDEDLIGHQYTTIDKVAYTTENNHPQQVAIDNGVTQKQLDEILELNKLSQWKRTNTHQYPKISKD